MIITVIDENDTNGKHCTTIRDVKRIELLGYNLFIDSDVSVCEFKNPIEAHVAYNNLITKIDSDMHYLLYLHNTKATVSVFRQDLI